ncbi:unnamed protein product [Brassica oleracea]|uniref:(rape) hypothetical protein n=1 Tax=Brassica napus TaxID=3708 RepID=A0A816IIS5_BRANA|nr:unnamed protein product [Brassica napus]
MLLHIVWTILKFPDLILIVATLSAPPLARSSACGRRRAPSPLLLFSLCCPSTLLLPCRYTCGSAVGFCSDKKSRARPLRPGVVSATGGITVRFWSG